MTLRRKYDWFGGMLVAGLMSLPAPPVWGRVLGFLTALTSVPLFGAKVRCPHCGLSLVRVPPRAAHCPRCGEKIPWDEAISNS